MRTLKAFVLAVAVALIASWSVFAAPPGKGPGAGGKGHGAGHGQMSDDFRGVIHSLFADHEKVKRSVELTDDGYRATTTSDDAKVAATLKKHVAQMESRLEGGLGVRHWDPAFVELREHYDDMAIKVENVEKGVAVSVVGKTPAAIKVAQNHAAIISGFVKKGGEQMHATHAAVVTKTDGDAASAPVAQKGGCGSCVAEKEGARDACRDGQCGKGDKPCCAARAGKAAAASGPRR
jgi:hypothetical protein